MNSGKSMQLLATAYGLQEKHIPFLLLKSSVDTRDVGVIKSRGLGKRECIIVKPEDSILTIFANEWGKSNYPIKWIFVDEAQFLTEKQVGRIISEIGLVEAARRLNKQVIDSTKSDEKN
jgi:thymidine kinase